MNRITLIGLALLLGSAAAFAQGTEFGAGKGDEVGSTKPPAGSAPTMIEDLAVTATTVDSITIAWSAPSDPDGFSGQVREYDVRYSLKSPKDYATDTDWFLEA